MPACRCRVWHTERSARYSVRRRLAAGAGSAPRPPHGFVAPGDAELAKDAAHGLRTVFTETNIADAISSVVSSSAR